VELLRPLQQAEIEVVGMADTAPGTEQGEGGGGSGGGGGGLVQFKKRGNIRKRGARKKKAPKREPSDSDSEGGRGEDDEFQCKKVNPNMHRTKRAREGGDGAEEGKDAFGFRYASDKSMATMGEGARSDATRTHMIDDPNAPGMSAGAKAFRGPMRAPTNVRTTMRIDYQPDLCKDYKDTGYCGYGDACKFMHDRGDYLTGWQLEKQWQAQQAERKRRFMEGGGPGEDGVAQTEAELAAAHAKRKEDELPWGCLICRGPFVSAVETRCKHYFCEGCALRRYNVEKVKVCFACMQPTNGIFNVAKALRAREKTEREIAVAIAAKMGVEKSTSTAFLLSKAEKDMGEPEGKTTLDKLRWIAERLGAQAEGGGGGGGGAAAAEAAAAEAEAEAADAELEQRSGAWAQPSKVAGWSMGGSAHNASYATGGL
jgi:RING finger protein 113A